jgi:precorrin-6Y C5,15-methyltransferase (decarboxylating)
MRSCEVFAGGDAALASAPAWGTQVRIAGPLDAVIAEIGRHLDGGRDVCVLTSGDPGYFSMLAALERAFPGESVVEPGVASVQLLAARVGVPWQEFTHLSVHGRGLDLKPSPDRPCAVLCGGENTPAAVAAHMVEHGFVGRAAVGVRLGWPDETVTVGTLAEAAAQEFGSPAVLVALPDSWLEAGGWTLRPRGSSDAALRTRGSSDAASPTPGAAALRPALRAPGVPDEAFERVEKVPLSRWEVRAVLAAVGRPADRRVIWDIGAGSGGFAVEFAMQSPLARVVAFERDPEGCAAIRVNAAKLGARVEVVQGEAPSVLPGQEGDASLTAHSASSAGHPAPDDGHQAPDLVVIGGSGGHLEGVLTAVEQVLAPGGRVVVTAVTLDTMGTASRVLSTSPWTAFDALQLSSARLDRAGIMRGMNPITLLWADKGEA